MRAEQAVGNLVDNALRHGVGKVLIEARPGQNGVVALVEANPKEFKVAASFREADRSGRECWAHPVIANGKLYIRDQDTLFSYDVKAK